MAYRSVISKMVFVIASAAKQSRCFILIEFATPPPFCFACCLDLRRETQRQAKARQRGLAMTDHYCFFPPMEIRCE